MKKFIYLIVCIMISTFYSQAQIVSTAALNDAGTDLFEHNEALTTNASFNSGEVVTVISVKGKVKYAKPGARRFKKLKPGALLDGKGKIKVKRKASIKLLKNGAMHSFSSKGKHSLKSLSSPQPVSTMDQSEQDFLAFLSDASGWGGPGKGGGHEDTSGNSDGGFLNKTLKLKCLSPASGKVPAKKIAMVWGGASNNGYIVKVYQDDEVIFTKKTNSKNIMVDLTKMDGVEVGGKYHWEVSEEKSPGVFKRSKKVKFMVVDADDSAKVLKDMRNAGGSSGDAQWESDLKEAFALHDAGFNSEAEEKFAKATDDYPSNDVVSTAYKYFRKQVVK